MLNIKRQILIALLNQKKGLRSSDLAKQLDVTPRTIRNNITELNRSLQGKVIGYRRPFFYISNPELVRRHIFIKDNQLHYPNYPSDRPFLIYLQIYNQPKVKIQEISSKLHIGRNEIENSIKGLKRLCCQYHLKIETNSSGISLVGQQIWQNYVLALLSTKRISRLVKNQYLYLIFQEKFSKDKFISKITTINNKVKNEYNLQLEDKDLYVLALMTMLENGTSKQYQKFYQELIFYVNSKTLKLCESDKVIYQSLVKVFPQYKDTIYNGLGNISHHLKLVQLQPSYFSLNIKKTKIANITLSYTEQDKEFISFLRHIPTKFLRKRIVVYESNIFELTKYGDKLAFLTILFPELEIKLSNNLFDLDKLLHVKNEQIIFLAKKERISLFDEKYHIQFFKLEPKISQKLIYYLLEQE